MLLISYRCINYYEIVDRNFDLWVEVLWIGVGFKFEVDYFELVK